VRHPVLQQRDHCSWDSKEGQSTEYHGHSQSGWKLGAWCEWHRSQVDEKSGPESSQSRPDTCIYLPPFHDVRSYTCPIDTRLPYSPPPPNHAQPVKTSLGMYVASISRSTYSSHLCVTHPP